MLASLYQVFQCYNTSTRLAQSDTEYKVADQKENDAAKLLKQLLTKKAKELGWEVFWELDCEMNSLDKLFWMSPEQVQ